MQRVKLDAIDLRILRDLQKDGRITNVDLAKNAGISAPPCLRRVRALEESGYIRGYHADVDGAQLGYKETFFALVGLDSSNLAPVILLSNESALQRVVGHLALDLSVGLEHL